MTLLKTMRGHPDGEEQRSAIDELSDGKGGALPTPMQPQPRRAATLSVSLAPPSAGPHFHPQPPSSESQSEDGGQKLFGSDQNTHHLLPSLHFSM